MCAFFSELELLVRGKDRGLTEGQTMHLYECKAVQILSTPWHSRIWILHLTILETPSTLWGPYPPTWILLYHVHCNVIWCLKLLAAGHIEDLYTEMMAWPCSKPTTYARHADVDEWHKLCFLPINDSIFPTIIPVPKILPIVITYMLHFAKQITHSQLPCTLMPLLKLYKWNSTHHQSYEPVHQNYHPSVSIHSSPPPAQQKWNPPCSLLPD